MQCFGCRHSRNDCSAIFRRHTQNTQYGGEQDSQSDDSLSEGFINKLNLDSSIDSEVETSFTKTASTMNTTSSFGTQVAQSEKDLRHTSNFKTDIEYDPNNNTRTTYLNIISQ